MPSARGNALAQLLGGNWDERSDLGRIVGYLAKTLSDLLGQVTQLNFTDAGDPSVVILGPYLARGIPEVGFAILLARPDPFRVLVLPSRISESLDDPGRALSGSSARLP